MIWNVLFFNEINEFEDIVSISVKSSTFQDEKKTDLFLDSVLRPHVFVFQYAMIFFP